MNPKWYQSIYTVSIYTSTISLYSAYILPSDDLLLIGSSLSSHPHVTSYARCPCYAYAVCGCSSRSLRPGVTSAMPPLLAAFSLKVANPIISDLQPACLNDQTFFKHVPLSWNALFDGIQRNDYRINIDNSTGSLRIEDNIAYWTVMSQKMGVKWDLHFAINQPCLFIYPDSHNQYLSMFSWYWVCHMCT